MRIENIIFHKKRKLKSCRYISFSGIVAACIVILCLFVPLYRIACDDSVEEEFIVWQNGVEIKGEEAKKFAEENQRMNMEMMGKIMKEHKKLMRANYAVSNYDDI